MRYLFIEGKPYLWRDILQMRREQRKAARQPEPVLFELRDDVRPPSERTASDRYLEPGLFDR